MTLPAGRLHAAAASAARDNGASPSLGADAAGYAAGPAECEPYLSVVVPAWNRPEQLSHTVAELRGFLASRPFATELIVVDDHSDGPTREVLEQLRRSAAGVRVLRNDRNRGKGYSTRRGLLAASGRYRIFTDADLAYSPHELARILRRLEHGADVAVACRALPGSRAIRPRRRGSYGATRHALSRAFNAVVQRVVLPGILDTQAGLKGFTAAAVQAIFPRMRVHGFAFDVEALVIARRRGLRVVQEAVAWREDGAPSTVRMAADTARMARDVARICFNQLLARYD